MLKNLFAFLQEVLFPQPPPPRTETVSQPQPVETKPAEPQKEPEDPLLDSAPAEEVKPKQLKHATDTGLSPECMYCHKDMVFQVSGSDTARNGTPVVFANWVCPACFAGMAMVNYSGYRNKKPAFMTMSFWHNTKEHDSMKKRLEELQATLPKEPDDSGSGDGSKTCKS